VQALLLPEGAAAVIGRAVDPRPVSPGKIFKMSHISHFNICLSKLDEIADWYLQLNYDDKWEDFYFGTIFRLHS
jgi:hypothetical protein